MQMARVLLLLLMAAAVSIVAAEQHFCDNTKYGTTLCDGSFNGSTIELAHFRLFDNSRRRWVPNPAPALTGTLPTELNLASDPPRTRSRSTHARMSRLV